MDKRRYKDLDELMENRVFYYFNEISKIPHASFEEKELSDFIVKWAKDLGLEVAQDKFHNVLIRKAATVGYEEAKPIIIQGHIDMVCEKSPGVEHDFSKDPIMLQLDGDILSTGNRTTLGADNGIAVAMAMAILESDSLEHPPLDVLLTTAEEEDLSGALNVDPSWFSTNRLINLDNSVENEVIAGSAGGKGAEWKLPIQHAEVPSDYKTFKIDISGLTGGHSGEDIHRGLANANILLAKLLNECRKDFEFFINDIKGGNFRLAIPRDAHGTISFKPEYEDRFMELVDSFRSAMVKQHIDLDPNISVEVESIPFQSKGIIQPDVDKIIEMIILSPNGIHNMLGSLNVVESSCNLGEIYIEDNHVYLITEIRATFDSNREYIFEKIEAASRLLGGTTREFAKYPSWTYKSDSKLRDLAQKTYKELFDEDMKSLVIHAGLECGCFSPKVEDLDAIAIGPNIWSLHSPSEALSVSSTDKIYKFLLEILKNLD